MLPPEPLLPWLLGGVCMLLLRPGLFVSPCPLPGPLQQSKVLHTVHHTTSGHSCVSHDASSPLILIRSRPSSLALLSLSSTVWAAIPCSLPALPHACRAGFCAATSRPCYLPTPGWAKQTKAVREQSKLLCQLEFDPMSTTYGCLNAKLTKIWTFCSLST